MWRDSCLSRFFHLDGNWFTSISRWLLVSRPCLHYSPVADRITRDRFREISRYLHFTDNSTMVPRGSPGHDRLGKVRPVLDHLSSRFEEISTTPTVRRQWMKPWSNFKEDHLSSNTCQRNRLREVSKCGCWVISEMVFLFWAGGLYGQRRQRRDRNWRKGCDHSNKKRSWQAPPCLLGQLFHQP